MYSERIERFYKRIERLYEENIIDESEYQLLNNLFEELCDAVLDNYTSMQSLDGIDKVEFMELVKGGVDAINETLANFSLPPFCDGDPFEAMEQYCLEIQ